jgi:hypothetical protein
VNVNERDEIAASVAAHAELGSRYDTAVAEGLVERIGDEIDRRIEARLGGPQAPRRVPPPAPEFPLPPPAPHVVAAQPPAPAHRPFGLSGVLLGLGSMGLGVGGTAVVTSNMTVAAGQVIAILLIWAAIAIINVAHAQRR